MFYLDRQIAHLVYLAVGYAHNLGLSRRPFKLTHSQTKPPQPGSVDTATIARGILQVRQEVHTAEEKRALLGCFYLLTM